MQKMAFFWFSKIKIKIVPWQVINNTVQFIDNAWNFTQMKVLMKILGINEETLFKWKYLALEWLLHGFPCHKDFGWNSI